MTGAEFVKVMEVTYATYKPGMRMAIDRWLSQEKPSGHELEALYDRVIRTYQKLFNQGEPPDPSHLDPLLTEIRRGGGDVALKRTEAYLDEIHQEKICLIGDGSENSERAQVEQEIARLVKKLAGGETGHPKMRLIKKPDPPRCGCGRDISEERKHLEEVCRDCDRPIQAVIDFKSSLEKSG